MEQKHDMVSTSVRTSSDGSRDGSSLGKRLGSSEGNTLGYRIETRIWIGLVTNEFRSAHSMVIIEICPNHASSYRDICCEYPIKKKHTVSTFIRTSSDGTSLGATRTWSPPPQMQHASYATLP